MNSAVRGRAAGAGYRDSSVIFHLVHCPAVFTSPMKVQEREPSDLEPVLFQPCLCPFLSGEVG